MSGKVISTKQANDIMKILKEAKSAPAVKIGDARKRRKTGAKKTGAKKTGAKRAGGKKRSTAKKSK